MTEALWYVLGTGVAGLLAATHAAIDTWLYNQPRPLSDRAELVLGLRWGFLGTVLIYAWLIDSHRVPYAEPGIWALFVGGIGLTILLAALIRRRKG